MEERKFYSLCNNDAFHIVFGKKENEDVVKALVLSIIDNSNQLIDDDFTLESPIVIPNMIDGKMPEYDLKIITSSGILIEIEMQNENEEGMRIRISFYSMLLFTSQLKKGNDYKDMKKAISILIQNYVDDEDFLPVEKITIASKRIGKDYVDILETYIVSLPLCKDDGSIFSQFMNLFKVKSWEELQMFLKEDSLDERVRKAAEALEEINEDKQVLIRLAAKRKAELDMNNKIHNAEKKAMEKGMERGEKQGIIKTAKRLLKEGFGFDIVSKVTGLSLEIIKKIALSQSINLE